MIKSDQLASKGWTGVLSDNRGSNIIGVTWDNGKKLHHLRSSVYIFDEDMVKNPNTVFMLHRYKYKS